MAKEDMFLKIEGVKGESKDSKHPDEIDVYCWSWGCSNAGTGHAGGGSGGGKVHVQDMTLTKKVDISSPELFLRVCSGKHYPKATLTVRKSGDQPLDYLTIVMEQVFITSYQTGGSAGSDAQVMETFTMNFATVTEEYKEQSKEGALAKPHKTGWNIAKNEKI